MDHLRNLNAAQRDAVLTHSGPLLVLAGAGTGKTRVITCRMVELIRRGIPADRILSVTFTNKAAREMLERMRPMLKGRQKPWISTFHSLCVNILRQDIEAIGYPKTFAILDRGDQEAIARTVLRELRVAEGSLRPGDLLWMISKWKSRGIGPGQSAESVADDREYLGAMAYRRYQSALRAQASVDFDDLLRLTDELFAQSPEALARQQARFERVQIDEYQDTNSLQFRLIDALVAPHRNLCVVGDDDQAIYSWRGAEVSHILSFARQFPDAKVVRLEDNYRCTQPILAAANRLVRCNRERHQKTLRTSRASTADVRFLSFPDGETEAEKVVLEIRFLAERKGVALRDIAILFRTNEQPRLFEAEMRRTGVRYVVMGTQSFFDRREVRDLLAYLKVLGRPRDEQSLLRILNTPARGISRQTAERVVKASVAGGSTFFEAAAACGESGEIPAKAAAAVADFSALLERHRARFAANPRKLDEALQELIREIGYDAELERLYPDPQQRVVREASVAEVIQSLSEYAARAPQPTLAGYLSDTALDAREEEPDKEEQAAQDAVKLLTLHSAKGLEFPRVYLVGMEEGLLPHKRSVEGTEREIEEERRLAYVGVTRAQDHLTLTLAEARRKWGKLRKSVPSRFIAEMQGDDAEAPQEAGHES